MIPQYQDDKLHEECGVFGIYTPDLDVARLTYFGLCALQHRGQESAGIATSDGQAVLLRKRLGLVSQVFSESDLRHLTGNLAVGHTRYSTTGSTSPENAGPMAAESDLGTIAVAHNGNVVNAAALRKELDSDGARLISTTDSEVITHLIARSPEETIVGKIQDALNRCIGAFSLAVLAGDQIIAVRDPQGIRPLVLGRIQDSWAVASETCALDAVGAEFVREIEAGEIVVLGPDGPQTYWLETGNTRAMCLFEFIYFARPDSAIYGKRLHLARQRMGEELAREAPVEDADVVIPLPESAIPAAIGYAREAGVPYSEGLIKNRYVGRTFIQPDQRLREMGVSLKFNALPEVVAGKRVVLVDDSIVRGTTSRPIVDLLRNAGAKEVHMRVHSPPIMHPCYLGVDMATREELIAANKSVEEIREVIGADSLAYLSVEGLIRATETPDDSFCTGCLTGKYPVPIGESTGKFGLEDDNGGTSESNGVIRLTPVHENGLESSQTRRHLVAVGQESRKRGEAN